VFLAIALTSLATWLLLRSAASADRWLPKNVLRAFERIMGLLLAAVAVEFIAGGVRDMIHPGG
jgi:multiple antibiotic resistance protein